MTFWPLLAHSKFEFRAKILCLQVPNANASLVFVNCWSKPGFLWGNKKLSLFKKTFHNPSSTDSIWVLRRPEQHSPEWDFQWSHVLVYYCHKDRKVIFSSPKGFYWQTELSQWEGGRLFDGSAGFFYGNSCNSGTESRKMVSKVGN